MNDLKEVTDSAHPISSGKSGSKSSDGISTFTYRFEPEFATTMGSVRESTTVNSILTA